MSKKRVNGAWVSDSPRIYNTSTDTITTLPKTIIGDGTAISSYTIKGNMQQSGTPTPQNPIYPTETGDKTANLFDKSTVTLGKVWYQGGERNSTVGGYSDYIKVTPETNYYIVNALPLSAWYSVCAYTANKQFIDYCNLSSLNATEGVITTQSNCEYIIINFYADRIDEVMVNAGSTALPYEPFGYKIPISSGNTTTTEYLGQVQTTRQIKKYVITGQEDTWVGTPASPSGRNRFYLPLESALSSDTSTPLSICSHLPLLPSGGTYTTDNGYTITNSNIYIRLTADYNSIADFKTYLQQQYTNGTPVCIWYVLATPTTGIVNEPIRKIGTYSDSVSGTNLPTIGTAETFDVDTTLKPSEVSLTYHGWHEHSDEKYVGG